MDRRTFFSACSVLTISPSFSHADQPERATIGQLIAQLGGRAFHEREEAAKTLQKLGEEALPALRAAAKINPDIEIRRRARSLVASIEREASGELWCFAGHTKRVNAVGLSADSRYAFSAGFDGTIGVCDAITGREMRRLRVSPLQVWSLALSPDGSKAFTGNGNGTISVRNTRTGIETHQLHGHRGIVWAIALSRDGQCLLSGDHDGTMRLWDANTGRQLRRIAASDGEMASHVYWVDFSSDGKRFLGCTGLEIQVRDLSGKELYRLREASPSMRAEFAPDGRCIFAGGGSSAARVWAIPARRELQPFRCQARKDGAEADGRQGLRANDLICLAITPDARRLVSGHLDGTVRFWDVAMRRQLRRSGRHTRRVGSVVCSRDGRWALSGSDDCTVRLWRIPP